MIENLSQQHGALFAAAICEKMYPNYVLFSQTEKWGNVGIYQRGIELLYKAAGEISSPVLKAEAQQTIAEFERVFPDLDAFESLAASFGFDASCALDSALIFVVSGNNEHLTHCAQFALNTVDMFVQEIEDLPSSGVALEAAIDNNEYMVRARQWQQELITTLLSISIINREVIAQLRQQQTSSRPLIDTERLPT